MVKYKRMKWAKKLEGTGEMRNKYESLVGNQK
jgi:hypothetical protein